MSQDTGGARVIHYRLPYMDVLRGTLMMLGVVLHALRIYDGSGTWLVQDSHSSPAAHLAVAFIHSFRMPAFFIIAGFFSALLLARRGPGEFLQQRLLRLVLPLATAALTLNLVQARLLQPGNAFRLWRDGMWLSHLWFLGYLLFYTALAIALYTTFAGPLKGVLTASMFTRTGFAVCLAALPTLTLGVQIVVGHVTKAQGFRPDLASTLEDLAFYSMFFFFGMLWNLSPSRELPVSYWLLLLLSGSAVALLMWLPASNGAARLTHRILPVALNWWAALLCLLSGQRWLNRDTAVFRYLSEASYSIYLFHHVFIVAIGMALLSFNAPPLVKAAVLIISTFSITMLIHAVVRRYAALSILLNGQTYGRERSAQSRTSSRTLASEI